MPQTVPAETSQLPLPSQLPSPTPGSGPLLEFPTIFLESGHCLCYCAHQEEIPIALASLEHQIPSESLTQVLVIESMMVIVMVILKCQLS